MKLNEILGRNVKNARKLRNLSQDKFAEMIGIETSTLSNIECGKSYPTIHTLEKIIEILDINPYILYVSDEDLNVEEIHPHAIDLLEQLKPHKTLYRRAYDFILELSQGAKSISRVRSLTHSE